MATSLAAAPIASVPGWTSNRQWAKYAEQTAATVTLAAGDSYFMRATANEGGGGDNLEIGVTVGGVGDFNPIPVIHPSDPTVALLVFDGDMAPPPPAPLPCASGATESAYNAAAGGVNYRKWDGIGGTGVEQLLNDANYQGTPPNDEAVLDIFEAPVNVCDQCGTEMDGWFKAADTGAHTFFISADDNAHLWFGDTVNGAMTVDPIANVPGWRSSRQWNKYGQQTAAPMDLVAGNMYYMRAVANEGGGGDNLEVGVTTPNGAENLLPITACSDQGNQYLYTVAAGVNYRRWNGIGGTGMAEMLAHANYNGNPPDETFTAIDFFESPSNVCDNCGTEMDGYFMAAADGDHIFQLAADDNAFLWFGADVDTAIAAAPIASVPGWTSARQWNKYGEQQAAPVTLVAGTPYYLRATANEGGGGDNLCVGVTGASGDMLPIPVIHPTDPTVTLLTFDSYTPPPPPLPCSTGGPVGVTYRRWNGVGGTGVQQLLDSQYSLGVSSADETAVLQIFEAPVNVCDNCGFEMEAYFLANDDGDHVFRISADDNAHFWFGATMAVAMSSPEIASVPGW